MDEVIPHLWLGDLACALAPDYLELAGVTHILTAMKQRLPPPPMLPGGRSIPSSSMHHVKVDDLDDAPILVHLPAAVDWLKEALDETWVEAEEEGEEGWWQPGENVVYVHCQAGVSRSATIVLAYLMHTRSLSLQEALELVKSRRSHIEPNAGFMTQLELYEAGGCAVDVRHQPIRRFLMSQTSILNGDSIDDVLLAYYPSPPASESRRRSSSATSSGSGKPKLSPTTMSRVSSRSGASETLDLSKSPPLPAGAELLDTDPQQREASLAAPRATSSTESSTTIAPSRPAKLQSSVTGPPNIEFKITANNGRLPGGVKSVRGNEGIRNRGTLQRPTFHGPKLSCKMCRRELAASDHVVDHLPGSSSGKGTFQSRRRKKDWEKLSREEKFGSSSSAANGARGPRGWQQAHDGANVGQEELPNASGSGKTSASDAASVSESDQTALADQAVRQEGDAVAENHSASSASTSSATPTPTPTQRPMQSAAALSASLPPALAALRLGRSSTSTTSSAPAPAPAFADRSASSQSNDHQRTRLMHSNNCSAYFVEPLQWMSALKEGEIAGKLDCPNARCGAKLGNWDWAGMQCGCGEWITPAFALHRTKVDEVG
ncbi:Dual specificity phosphatase [Ceraceosorus bombacis]|uniref:protein-tyrosine-phosphatase n=1 Tax=Ceraceosorus bombacis TaxID=401625 RepID=A0A0N7LAJ7_9BASI|nr:Dual specificity phosphatase [Ceraceosorus bombacis]